MSTSEPMTPAKSANIPVTTSNQVFRLPPEFDGSDCQIRLVNAPTNGVMYYATGPTTGATAAVAPTASVQPANSFAQNCHPIYPGEDISFSRPSGDSYLAMIGATAGTVGCTVGFGL